MRGRVGILMAVCALAWAVASPPPAFAQKQASAGFPEYWRNNFMNGCTEVGAEPAICGCALRGFEFSWPFWLAEEYDAAGALPPEQRTARQVELIAAADRIVLACVSDANAY